MSMKLPHVNVQGRCDTKFGRIKSVFEHHFNTGIETGAGLTVTVDGRIVVDLWGGYADAAQNRIWQRDTLVNVYSTTKGITAACIHRLVDQGYLDLDRTIAYYWPEFAEHGKEMVTLRQILSHRAGLPAIKDALMPGDIFNWETMTRTIAAQPLWWQPGTMHGYHARTYGWLLGEIVRRVTGKSIGAYFRDEIAAPLEIDFHIGLDAKHFPRVARISKVPPPPPGVSPNLVDIMKSEPDGITAMAFNNPPIYKIRDAANTPEWRSAEIPSSNGHGTARAIARFYGTLACGGRCGAYRMVSEPQIAEAGREHSCGEDTVLKTATRFGLGFMMPLPGQTMGPNSNAFGHPGMGGSLGFADPEARIGFGYVMNRSGGYILIDKRPAALINALYEALK